MAARLVHETPMEYFRGLVLSALDRQRVASSEETTFYVVSLLDGFVRPTAVTGQEDERPLGVRLAEALQTGGSAQREGLRRVGDLSLFTSGFFADSFSRAIVDIDYYIALGGYAYGSLSHEDSRDAAMFGELAEKFGRYVDVLSDVCEHTSLSSNADLLRLYEKWLRTGSRRDGERLVARGIVPNQSGGSRFVQ
jgi:hypothetical protein